MDNFMKAIKETLNEDFNYSVTENGALGYETTGKYLLDLNFKVSSLRNCSEEEIIKSFKLAFFEDKELAIKWLFYARDIRQGLGERRLFRIITKWLLDNHIECIGHLLELIPEYGRYDDIIDLMFDEYGNKISNNVNTVVIQHIIIKQLKKDILNITIKQLEKDILTKKDVLTKENILNYNQNEPVSLLAKWLPSINTSSKITKRKAKVLSELLHLNEKQYRKALSILRKYIDVTEVKMSSREWDKIKYENVPSKANLIYKEAFLRNDEKRRIEYLEKVSKGQAKINADVLFPHEIVNKYRISMYETGLFDVTLEELWRASSKINISNTLVIQDGSGSMYWNTICKANNISPIDVSVALAIYFAENAKDGFKNTFITFGKNPRIVDISKAKTLKEKINITLLNNDCTNTDIEKTFDLILCTAIKNKIKQEDLPQNVLIVSDMEFDACCDVDKRLFEHIKEKFEKNNYKMPRLIFWNVSSRTNTIPIKENELGVTLVSGFSINTVKMIMSKELNPYKCLVEQLMSDRYKDIKIK